MNYKIYSIKNDIIKYRDGVNFNLYYYDLKNDGRMWSIVANGTYWKLVPSLSMINDYVNNLIYRWKTESGIYDKK
jgi:hypothetical protein